MTRLLLAARCLVLLAPVMLLGSTAFGNAAPIPREPKPPPAGPFMTIEQVPGLERAKLIVPKKLLPAEKKADAGLSPTRTAVAGVAISAAVGLLGLQLFRRRGGKPGMLLIVGGVTMALVSAAAIADIPVPGRERPRPPGPPPAIPAGVPVTMEVVDDGDAIILQIAPEHMRGDRVAPPAPGAAAPSTPPSK